MLSDSCLVVKTGPICISMVPTLGYKNSENHSLHKSYNRGIWKTFIGLGLKEESHACIVGYLSCYICNLFLFFCFFYALFMFQEVP